MQKREDTTTEGKNTKPKMFRVFAIHLLFGALIIRLAKKVWQIAFFRVFVFLYGAPGKNTKWCKSATVIQG